MVPPLNETEPAPAVGEKVPPQVVDPLGVAATTTPAGKLSLNATPVIELLRFGLLIVNVSVDVLGVPTVRMVCGLNDFAMLGGLSATRLAVAKPVAVVFWPVIGEEMKPLTFGC